MAEHASNETLKGLIERVTCHDPDSGFCVLRVTVKGRREPVAVVGSAAAPNAGEWLVAEGSWMMDRDHGRQFRAKLLKTSPPTSREGIEKFLASGLIKGIGPVYARKLVEKFGDRVLDVIDSESGRLTDVEGIGVERRKRIKAAWQEQKAIREVMVFLHSHGVGTSRAVRIYKTYGDSVIETLRADPYRLARDIPGIGFKTADTFARNLGVPENSLMRASAAVEHALAEAASGGHTHLPREEAAEAASRLTAAGINIIEQGIDRLIAEGDLAGGTSEGSLALWLPHLDRAERGLARRVNELLRRPAPWPAIALPAAIAWCERRFETTLSDGQRRGLETCLGSAFSIITGGPGVGKTTLVRSLAAILQAKGMKLALCAPTGRAARRLAESVRDLGLETSTIHRLLGAGRAGFEHGPDKPVPCDVIIADEASMIDLPLMHRLAGALDRHAALILVGDADQLPSVGPGRVLGDLIGFGAVPVARLTEVFRQAAGSRIIQAAHAVNRGELPPLDRDPEADFLFLQRDSPDEIRRTILELASRRVPKRLGLEPIEAAQILAPMNRGDAGVRALNEMLQKALNPPVAGAPSVMRFGWEFRIGDKVMQTENDPERDLSNGDLGRVTRIDLEEGLLEAVFDGRTAFFSFGELDTLMPAYATTIHKSQGSEFPCVILPLATQHFVMLRRNLLYTAITRGKRLVVIVGQRRALELAVRSTDGPGSRRSALIERLRQTAAV